MQNRKAPAFQEYAAEMIAQLPYRQMTLSERGLLCSMRLECWVNGQLPEKPEALAKVLGFTAEEISNSLPAIMPFFAVLDGYIICPELKDYRQHLADRKEKQSIGGKNGAAITNRKRALSKNLMATGSTSTLSSTPQLPRQGDVESLVQSSTVKPSQTQSSKKEVIKDPWVADYENAEKTEYALASRGG